MNREHEVTVNILTTPRREEYLRACLEGLRQQTYMGAKVQIIGFFNENILADFRKDLEIRVIRVDLGIARKRSLAVTKTTTKYAAFIDDDEIPSKNWLKELLDTIEKYENVGVITGPVITPLHMLLPKMFLQNVSMSLSLLRKLFWNYFYEGKLLQPGEIVNGLFTIGHFLPTSVNKIVQVNVSGFGNILFPTWVAKKILIDPIYNYAYEDYDFVIRVRRLGYKVLYNTRAFVFHLPRTKEDEDVSRAYLLGFDEGVFYKKMLLYYKWIFKPKWVVTILSQILYRLLEKREFGTYNLLGFMRGFRKSLDLKI